MDQTLNFIWVQGFIANKFPDPDPELVSVRAYRAVAGVLYSAALLGTAAVPELARFTGLHPAFIAAISWNMLNNHLWTPAGYDSSGWLSHEGEMNEVEFLEHVGVAWGDMWCEDVNVMGYAIDVYDAYRRLLLVWLLQQAPTGSVEGCHDHRFPRLYANFKSSLLMKRRVSGFWLPLAGPTALSALDVGTGVPTNW